MFVERDQIATPLQGRRDPLDALATGGNRSHPVGGPQRIDLQILVGEFAGDRQRPIGVVGCLRPIVGIEIDMAMRRDQRPSLAATIAELDGKLARPFEGLQRLRNGGPMVESDHVIGTPEPQQRLHLLGGRALFCRLAHRELQVGRRPRGRGTDRAAVRPAFATRPVARVRGRRVRLPARKKPVPPASRGARPPKQPA